MIEDYTLEEILEKGLREARDLFEQELPIHADYTLYLVRTRYSGANMPIPEQLTAFETELKDNIIKTYPIKIEKKVQDGDISDAIRMFISIVGVYNRKNSKIPIEFYKLKELIVSNKDKACDKDSRDFVKLFEECYPIRFFD